MPRLSETTIAALKLANPIEDLIGKKVKLGRVNGRGVCEGACLCAPVRGKAPLWVNTGSQTFGCLKPNGCGGDIFTYLEQFEGLDFASAVRALGGADIVGDETALAAMQAKRDAAKAERLQREARHMEAERAKAWSIWQRGVPAVGTPVETYLRHRGISIVSPALRFSREEPFYIAGARKDDPPQLIHVGPCMLAAIQAPDGRFCGVHRTWLAPLVSGVPSTANGKAVIVLPDGTPADVKKMRGIKKRGAIRLRDCRNCDGAAERVLLIGEGVETTGTALDAVLRHGRPGVDYYAWAAGDLGNISGGGLGASVPHRTRPGLWVPPAEPDMTDPGVLPPDWAARVILLGDGDSDPETTSARLACGKARYERLGTPTAIRMAPPGVDFNDWAMAS